MIANVCNRVIVVMHPHPLRMHRRETPILPRRENQIGWRSARCIEGKLFAVTPDIKAVDVQTERKVKVQNLSAKPRALRQRLKLLLNSPLRIDVVACHVLVKIIRRDRVLKPPWPTGPATPQFIDDGSEFGVQEEFRVLSCELFDTANIGWIIEKSGRIFLENTAPKGHFLPVV